MPHDRQDKRGLSNTDVDVLVVGGGMAGCFAALGAKTRGLSVLIIEPHNVLGGQGTAGGVAGFCGDTSRVNKPFSCLVAKLENHSLIAPLDHEADRRPFDLEYFAYFLQEHVLAKGIDVFFHARMIDVRCGKGRITEVRVAAGGVLHTYRPRYVIDATGECVVAHKASFPVQHEQALHQLPMSLYFTLWDSGKKVTPFLPEGCPAWSSEDELPMTTLHAFPTGKLEVKMKVIGFDAADPKSVSAAEVHARRQMMGLIYYLQTRGYRGRVYDTHVLASVSRQIGIREGRRIVGEYVLTEDDLQSGTRFDDVVAIGTYHLDYHWPDRLQRAGTGITTHLEPYHIPLRILTPKGAKNLLVPGRGASGDQMAMSSFRIMATCAQMGFAAGMAARVGVQEGCDIEQLDVKKVQRLLQRKGQSLNLADYGQYLAQQRSRQTSYHSTD